MNTASGGMHVEHEGRRWSVVEGQSEYRKGEWFWSVAFLEENLDVLDLLRYWVSITVSIRVFEFCGAPWLLDLAYVLTKYFDPGDSEYKWEPVKRIRLLLKYAGHNADWKPTCPWLEKCQGNLWNYASPEALKCKMNSSRALNICRTSTRNFSP